jgi:hypothetical protein
MPLLDETHEIIPLPAPLSSSALRADRFRIDRAARAIRQELHGHSLRAREALHLYREETLAEPQQLTRCRIIPDAVDPAIVSAVVSWTPMKENPPPYVQVDNFVTFDGGQHWQPFNGPQPFAVDWTAT